MKKNIKEKIKISYNDQYTTQYNDQIYNENSYSVNNLKQ